VVVLFIALGLLLALAWVRMSAPDVALAEAAIGAGLTGVLLLEAIELRARRPGERGRQVRRAAGRTVNGVLPFAAAGGFALIIGIAVLDLPGEAGGLSRLSMERLPETGVGQPVTAVLLSYRAYDTWLEIAVLLLAALAALSIRRAGDLRAIPVGSRGSPVLLALLKVVVPVGGLVAIYLYWAGTHAPGGAFQAGAVGAAALVLLRMAGFVSIGGISGPFFRGVLLSAFAGFLIAAVLAALLASNLLEYRGAAGEATIMALEATVVIATAATLASLFVANSPDIQRREEQ
jgi:multisubunit Na+/H+ antiporter MnhB subunit